MPKIKMIEAATDKPISELTYANAEDYKGITLTHRSTGMTTKIIGKFVSFGGTEWIALDNGHFMEPLTVRKAFRTDGDLDGYDKDVYKKAIVDAYIKQAKDVGWTVPKEGRYGQSNPTAGGGEFLVVNKDGTDVVFRVIPHGSSTMEVYAYASDNNRITHSGDFTVTKKRLMMQGSPEKAAEYVVSIHPIPDFPEAR